MRNNVHNDTVSANTGLLLKYLPLIPARGGSKGIPRKNIVDCAGRPLMAWTIEAALDALGAAYVSTEDAEIADVARHWGAEVIDRPAELAGDHTPTEDVVIHALGQVEAEAVVLLQATSPTRISWDIQKALKHFERHGYDSLLSLHGVGGHCLWQTSEEGIVPLYAGRVRRQDAPLYLIENGAIYISKARCYTEYQNRLAGKVGHYIMGECRDVDTASDLMMVTEELMRQMSG